MTVPQVVIDEQNPWPGLGAFDEAAERFFNGRRTESAELRRLVLLAPLTVLFGASGLGKTSLVLAGLSPLVRKDYFLPVYVRLDVRDRNAPLIEQAKFALQAQVQARRIDAAVDDHTSLWQYLHRAGLELWSEQNQLLTPLFIFDQFEEVFTLGAENPAAIARLRIDLADLIENRVPATVADMIQKDEAAASALSIDNQRYKVLLSFREDFLPAVEDWKRDLPSILRTRLRLLPMSSEQAFEAVYNTAPQLVDEPLARRIVRFVAATQEDGTAGSPGTGEHMKGLDVEPALLSLLCHGLNEKRKAECKAAFDEVLLSGSGQSIISDYYQQAVRDLPEPVQRFIEKELITERGFRKACDVGDARSVHGVADRELRLLVDRRLLRIEPQRGTERVELTHDLLTHVVREQRDRQRLRRKRKRISSVIGMLLTALVVTFVLVSQYANTQRERAQEQAQLAKYARYQAKRAAEQAEIARTARDVANRALATALQNEKAAKDERARATEQARISDSRALAAAALNNVDIDPQLSALLATAAVSKANTREAMEALQRAVPPPAARITLAEAKPPADENPPRLRNPQQLIFSDNGERLLAVSRDGKLFIWNLADRNGRAAEYNLPGAPAGEFAFSGDARLLAVGREDNVAIFDTETRRSIRQFGRERANYRGLAFSADGRTLAVWGCNHFHRAGCNSSYVDLWDIADGHSIASDMTGISGDVSALAFSIDGRWLGVGGGDEARAGEGMIEIWDLKEKDPKKRVEGRRLLVSGSGRVNGVAFSDPARPRLFFSAAESGRILTLDLYKYQIDTKALRGYAVSINTLTFNLANGLIATAGEDRSTRIWDANSFENILTLRGHTGGVRNVVFSPDGSRLATASEDGMVKVWDVPARRIVYDLSSDGRFLAAAGQGRTSVLDIPSGREIGSVSSTELDRIVFGPDGNLVASVKTLKSADRRARDNQVEVHIGKRPAFDKTESTLCCRLSIQKLAFDRAGKRLAAVGDTIALWDISSARELNLPAGIPSSPLTVALSPDGSRLAVVDREDHCSIHDLGSGRKLPMVGRVNGYEPDIRFSPNGRILAAFGGVDTVLLWDAFTGRVLHALKGHRGSIYALAFRADGSELATGSADNTAKIWDVVTGEELLTLTGHGEALAKIAFTQDGRRLVTVSKSGAVLQYLLHAPDLVTFARKQLTREFRRDECLTYFHQPQCPE